MLEAIPGPESLRVLVAAAGNIGADPRLVIEASEAIERFAELVRKQFGTRSALNAAIGGGGSANVRHRIDQAGRTDVFRGMRQILGVEANTWLTAMIFSPSREDDEIVSVMNIQGALGMRRLRSDTEVYFSVGAPYRVPGVEPQLAACPVVLDDLYSNEPATLHTTQVGGQLRHRLVHDRLGKDAVADMVAVSLNANGSRRYATPEAPLRGVSLFVDVPVRTLVCDAIVHRSLFPGSEPELIVYNPGARGPANPNDRSRDLDRVAARETPSLVPATMARFDVPEIPNYDKMIQRVCGHIGHELEDFRVFRVRVTYPVYGFQFVMAFRAPMR
jgi:hypothetical protein